MPKATVNSGVSNAGATPDEPGYIESPVDAQPAAVAEDVAASALEAPAVPAAAEGAEPEEIPPAGSAPDYGSMTQAALRDEAKSRGLPVGGTKADLAARLAGHDAAAETAEAGEA